jgi:hypothetical protein
VALGEQGLAVLELGQQGKMAAHLIISVGIMAQMVVMVRHLK